MMGTPSILLSLAVLSTGVLAFPTAQHDQILVHHTPMHDVVFIPEFMMGGDHHQHQMTRRQQHGRVHMDSGYARGHHQHHHEEPQRICLQQVGTTPEYQEQPQEQHIMLNPNHAVYISTQDEFGNLRTFKISSSNALLQQSMLTGQEIPQKQDASNVEEKKDQEKIVEEIVTIENTEEKAGNKTEETVNQQPEETQIETPKEGEKQETVEEEKEKSVDKTPKENTQEESPKENSEETPKEKAEVETPKEIIQEETPKENAQEETPKENTQDETPKENAEESTPKAETKEEVVIVEPETEQKETSIESNEDEDKVSGEEVHSIEKRDVSSVETLDDVEKETEATEHISKEAQISKKDLSESVEEKIESSESVEKPPTSEEVESVERTNIQKIEKAITSHENVTIVTTNSDETVETTEVPQITKDLVPVAVNSSQESEDTPIKNQTSVVKQTKILAEEPKVLESIKEVESKEISESDEQEESETTQEILTPVSTTTPAPRPEGVLPVPEEILATTPALPILLSTSAEIMPEAQ